MRKDDDRILFWTKKIKAINKLGGECKHCCDNNIKHLTFHHKNPNEKDYKINHIWTRRWSDIEKEIDKCILLCDNCHRELHYNENIDKRQISKKLYVEYKGNKCEKCGYDKCNSALTFHHKDIEEKNFNIGSISVKINNIDDLSNDMFNELEKCELLCANCHRELHTSDININEITIKEKRYKETNKKLDRNIIYKMYFDDNLKITNISKILNCSKGTICDIIKKEKNKRKEN